VVVLANRLNYHKSIQAGLIIITIIVVIRTNLSKRYNIYVYI